MSRERAVMDRVSSYVASWPEELRGMFWSAVNAPTYAESAELTLAFASGLARELAEQQRAVDFGWYEEDSRGAEMARDHLADLIDPAKESDRG